MKTLPKEKYEITEMEQFIEKYELHKMHNHVVDRTVYLVIAALGLIAALAWDDALHDLFDKWFGGTESTSGKFLYAALITIFAASISVLLGRRFRRKSKKKHKN